MNFILNHNYSDGNTPIRPEEVEQLIPRISTMGELNEYEALNILRAREWAFASRTMKAANPLEEPYVRELHHRMFDQVWKWAGTYRKHELNIGCAADSAAPRQRPVLAGPQDVSGRRMPGALSPSAGFENPSVSQRKWTPRAHDDGRTCRQNRAAGIHLGCWKRPRG
jgi:hypothetical protein